MEELFNTAVENGIKFTTEYQKTDTYIVPFQLLMIIQVKARSKYVILAVNTVLDVCEKGATLIIESTLSPGSIDRYIRPEIEKRGFVIGKDIHLAHAPEKLFLEK